MVYNMYLLSEQEEKVNLCNGVPETCPRPEMKMQLET